MEPNDEIVSQRLAALQFAKESGNVSEACRRFGISRTQFYEYRRRFTQDGLQGLKDRPPIHKHHPFTTRDEVVEKVIELSLQHPAWGCGRLSDALRTNDHQIISSPTVQKILIKHNLGKRAQRIPEVERRSLEEGLVLTCEQKNTIRLFNPRFFNQAITGSRPGEILCTDTLTLDSFLVGADAYLHALIDTFSCYTFAVLSDTKRANVAVDLLSTQAVPLFQTYGLEIHTIVTRNRIAFLEPGPPSYNEYLASNNIAHKHTRSEFNGFIQCFHWAFNGGFVMNTSRPVSHQEFSTLKTAFSDWLSHYNARHPQIGYPNKGLSALEKIRLYVATVRKED